MHVTIIDYGVGNVGAFLNCYHRLNLSAGVARTPAEIESSTHLILPGVGAFDSAMLKFRGSGMSDALIARVSSGAAKLLGVCVGMQMLARRSEEGLENGLGLIPGDVRHFRSNDACRDLPLPHMGWNDVAPSSDAGLFSGLEAMPRFYFLHSYYFQNDRKEDAMAVAEYGAPFSCAVTNRSNVFGVQFHPEKSHHWGATLLKNFAGL